MLLSEPPDWLQHVHLGIVAPVGLGGDRAGLQDVVIDDDELFGLLLRVAPPRHQRPTLLPEPELYCGHQTDASLDIKFHECFKWKLLILLHFPANDEMSKPMSIENMNNQ